MPLAEPPRVVEDVVVDDVGEVELVDVVVEVVTAAPPA
jgi:hypothetical protein